MKIGILTYHCVPNFGAQLQATSTVGYLKRKGHEPVILHWYPMDLEQMYVKKVPAQQIAIHNEYTNDKLPVSVLCRTEDELVNTIDSLNLDAVILGSDALFKYMPQSLRRFFNKRKLRFQDRKILSVFKFEGNPFFGSFVNKLKHKIPVSAFSISSENCPYVHMKQSEVMMIGESMRLFNRITVRDEWTKRMVELITGRKDIVVTPDPVFSFNQNLYFPIPSKEDIIRKYKLPIKYVLVSFTRDYVNNKYIEEIANELKTKELEPVAFPMPENLFDAGIKTKIALPLDPIDWYALIKYSSGYIGERMHPIVVCLHNAVPFFSFDNYGVYEKTMIGLKKLFLNESSKIYHIVNKAGFDNCTYNYNSRKFKPKPKEVVLRIADFDVKKCEMFSQDYQMQYEKGMNIIIESLSKE
jgi:hypothetical protein